MAELIILRTNYARFDDLVELVSETAVQFRYRPIGATYKSARSKAAISVRNATPELFQKLKSLEGGHQRKKAQVLEQMEDQFDERIAKILAAPR